MNDRFSAAMMEASVSELELSVRWFDRDLLSNTNRRETQVFEVEVDLRFLKMKKKIEISRKTFVFTSVDYYRIELDRWESVFSVW